MWMIVVRVEQDRVQPGGASGADVHRHRVTDVGDATSIEPAERDECRLEDRRVGFGDADHMTIDHHPNGNPIAVADLTHTTAAKYGLDLPTGVRHDPERHAVMMQQPQRRDAFGNRPPPQMGVARVLQRNDCLGDIVGSDANRVDVGAVVLIPKGLAASGRALDRHRPVVGPAMALDRCVTAVVGKQRAQNKRVGKDENTTSVEQDCVETGHDSYPYRSMRSPRDFFKPLAVGAPEPVRDVPFRPSRVIHFFPPHNDKLVAKLPELVPTVDILLGNLEDAIPMADKEAARRGLVNVARTIEMGATQLWTRVNSLDSPWGLDDLITLVTEVGDKLDVIMIPKVEGPEDIHYVDRLLAQLEAKAGLTKPLLVHAILETARGVANIEAICAASPRMQGLSLGPADLAANRRMKTTRVGGGHPDYLVRSDPDPENPEAARPTFQQDLWHYTLARMVDACVTYGLLPFYGPFGDIKDTVACEDQFRNAYLLGCVGAWSLHPAQISIAKRVFSPRPADVLQAQRVIDVMGDGTGAIMLDGKMEDDASVKQCHVVVNLARQLAARDADLAAAYGF